MSASWSLTNWIHPEYVRRFEAGRLGDLLERTPFENVVLDDFFLPEKIDGIEAYCERIPMEKNLDYGLGKNSQLKWGAFGNAEVLRFIYSASFREFLGALLREPVTMRAEAIPQYNRFSPKSRGLPVHTDFEDRRDVVMLLQLSKSRPEDGGGELCFHASPGEVAKRIVPKRNRLTLFKVSRRSLHSVADMNGDWTRELILFDWFLKNGRERK